MSKKTANLVLDMLARGYAPYEGHIDEEVYRDRKCRDGRKARWFSRRTEKSALFVCVGCGASCSLVNPTGFQATLPIPGGLPVPVVAGSVPVISDAELLRVKEVLRLDQMMAVCQISERKARYLIEQGEVDVLEVLPVRITSESVAAYLKRVKE